MFLFIFLASQKIENNFIILIPINQTISILISISMSSEQKIEVKIIDLTAHNNQLLNAKREVVVDMNANNSDGLIKDGKKHVLIEVRFPGQPFDLTFWLNEIPADTDPYWFDSQVSVGFDRQTDRIRYGSTACDYVEDCGPNNVTAQRIFNKIQSELIEYYDRQEPLPDHSPDLNTF